MVLQKGGLSALVLYNTSAVYAAGTDKGDRLQAHRFIGSNNASSSNHNASVLYQLVTVELNIFIGFGSQSLFASYAQTDPVQEAIA